MWFGSKGPRDISFWGRFHTAAEGFTVLQEESGLWTLHAVVAAERAVDLFLGLLNEFNGAVSVAMEDGHARRSWKGEGLQAAAVRSALAPLREPLATDGGVEVAVFNADDQVTINLMREIFIYSQSERWASLLEGKGVSEQRMVRTQSWKGHRTYLPPDPKLTEAVAAAALALGLEAAS